MPKPLEDNIERRDIAANVRAEMARAYYTQAGLAEMIGYTQARLSRRLTGEIPFTYDELVAIANVLACKLSALTNGNHVQP